MQEARELAEWVKSTRYPSLTTQVLPYPWQKERSNIPRTCTHKHMQHTFTHNSLFLLINKLSNTINNNSNSLYCLHSLRIQGECFPFQCFECILTLSDPEMILLRNPLMTLQMLSLCDQFSLAAFKILLAIALRIFQFL